MKQEWERKPFESCVEPVEYTRKIQRKDFLEDGQFPIISQEADFTNGYWNDEADVFRLSTPVVVFGDHTQVLKYVDFDFVLGADGVKILQPRDFLRPKFFFYQLWAANLVSRGYARHYRLLKELEIKVPPLPEQQRIVGILDEVFDGIATAKANAEKNLQNAHALFESHLQSIFNRRGAGWVERKKPLAGLCELIVDCEHKTAQTQDDGIPSIRTPNIGKGKLLLDGVYRVSEETYREWTRRAEPLAGDLILDVFDSQFLALLLLHPETQRKLLDHSRGATVQHVNMRDIRALDVGAWDPPSSCHKIARSC